MTNTILLDEDNNKYINHSNDKWSIKLNTSDGTLDISVYSDGVCLDLSLTDLMFEDLESIRDLMIAEIEEYENEDE